MTRSAPRWGSYRVESCVTDANILFSQHRDGVFRYIAGSSASRKADELTQEVFLRACACAGGGGRRGRGRAWVFRIARNLALNHLRDARRRPQTVELTERRQPATQELSVALQQALAALPDLDRDVFLMREIGRPQLRRDCLGVRGDVDAVRARLHHARVQLREALGRQVAERRASRRENRTATAGGIR